MGERHMTDMTPPPKPTVISVIFKSPLDAHKSKRNPPRRQKNRADKHKIEGPAPLKRKQDAFRIRKKKGGR